MAILGHGLFFDIIRYYWVSYITQIPILTGIVSPATSRGLMQKFSAQLMSSGEHLGQMAVTEAAAEEVALDLADQT
jgi:hypothetical protein